MSFTVQSVRRVYENGTVALEETNFSARSGELIALIGPSGCGKSTLLSLLAGLDKPTSGTVAIQGRVGMVFQEAALFPWLTVRDNVAFGLKMSGLSLAARQKKADVILRSVHLAPFSSSFPHELSGGMRHRVAIARAFILEPELLLLDEPFGALDEEIREQMQQLLLTLWEEQKPTICLVTHSVEEALTVADRVLVFSARPGRIIADLTLPKRTPGQKVAQERFPDATRHEIRLLLGREVQKAADQDLTWEI